MKQLLTLLSCLAPPVLASPVVPLPDAIIASVSFSDCKIVPESYEVNGTYRPITREEGFTVLRDTWLEAFKAAVAKKS